MTGQEAFAPLPKGPHHLSRAEVVASQRARLLDATLHAVGTSGYAALSIATVTSAARVSRSAFYQQFRDKEDAFLQAYERFAGEFVARLEAVSSAAATPLEAVDSSSKLLLRWLSDRPIAARAWLLEIYAVGEAGLVRRSATMTQVERLFDLVARWIRKVDPELSPLLPFAGRAVVAASFELLTDAVRDPSPERVAAAARDINGVWVLGMTGTEYAARKQRG